MNPLFSTIRSSNTEGLAGRMNAVRDPMSMLLAMSESNPNLKPIVEALRYGANPEAIVRQECARRNIDVNQLLREANGRR